MKLPPIKAQLVNARTGQPILATKARLLQLNGSISLNGDFEIEWLDTHQPGVCRNLNGVQTQVDNDKIFTNDKFIFKTSFSYFRGDEK